MKFVKTIACADPEGDGGPDTPLKKYKNLGFLSNNGLDPLKNHKAAKYGMSGVAILYVEIYVLYIEIFMG